MKDKFLKIAYVLALILFPIFILGGFLAGQALLWNISWLAGLPNLIIGGFAAIPLWHVEAFLLEKVQEDGSVN